MPFKIFVITNSVYLIETIYTSKGNKPPKEKIHMRKKPYFKKTLLVLILLKLFHHNWKIQTIKMKNLDTKAIEYRRRSRNLIQKR